MSNWSKPHPDVEEEIFTVLDLGISWALEEFATIYFSGLHFHGGSQPFYRTPRSHSNSIYNRLTLIGYPPNESINGTSSMAFAALPDGKLLKSYREMRLPACVRSNKSPNTSLNNHLSIMGQPPPHSCTQATFTRDGCCIMEPEDYIEFMVHSFAQQMTYYISQTDPRRLLRFDRDAFFSSFSFANDKGVRVGLRTSAYRPGWSGNDTKIGTAYNENLEELSEDELRLLHNSDLRSQAPYGNDILSAARELWEDHIRQTSMTIPICVVTEAVSPWNVVGGRPQARKGQSLSFSCKTVSQNLYHRDSRSTPQ
jgi:hypothetical protein